MAPMANAHELYRRRNPRTHNNRNPRNGSQASTSSRRSAYFPLIAIFAKVVMAATLILLPNTPAHGQPTINTCGVHESNITATRIHGGPVGNGGGQREDVLNAD